MSDDRTCNCSSHQQPTCAHWRMGHCPDKPMPEGVTRFPHNEGNGAKEALGSVLERLDAEGPINGLTRADQILALLWYDGFKVVPLADYDPPTSR
jgi:hypothetical protein